MIQFINVLAFLLFVSVISCAHICHEDGLVENKEDRTSYYECTDGKSYFRRCPEASDKLSYMVFDGKECVESYPAFVCPQENGSYRYMHNSRQYYQCIDNKPIMMNCPEHSRFDGLECVDLETEDKTNTVEEEENQEFICPSSTGVFVNPDDKHSYYECNEDEPKLKLCPRERSPHLHGHKKHRRRMIWDGHQCVQVHRISDNRNARQVREEVPDAMFTCPASEGRFSDPRDPRYYFHCKNNSPHQEICSGDTIFDEDQGICVPPPSDNVPETYSMHRKDVPHFPELKQYVQKTYPVRRQVSNDPTCPSGTEYDPATGRCYRVDIESPIDVNQPVVVDTPQCPSNSIYDPNTGWCRGEEFTSPIKVSRLVGDARPQCPSDSVYDERSDQCRKEIYVEPIRRVAVQPQISAVCQEGYTYDPNTGRCFREVLTDPIIDRVVRQQHISRCEPGFTFDVARGVCVRETEVDPIVNKQEYLQGNCGEGYIYNPNVRRCEPEPSGRYRRNGRVEMEDGLNGGVIVDTWNERQWRWDRNPNGERILPDVNGWLDRAMAHARAENANLQHVRGRPVQYVRG